MAAKLQIWGPETCQCVIEELHDPDTPGFGVQFSKVILKCPNHVLVADAALFGVLYSNPDGENKRKNLVHKALLETTSLSLATLGSDGTYTFKTGVSFSWSYNAARVLQISITGATLTTAQKNTVNTWCTNQFGVGKVLLV